MKRKYRIKCLALIVAALLIPASIGFAAGAREEAAAGVQTLDFWTLLTGAQGEVLSRQVARFNESQSGIVVNLIPQGGYAELQQKLLASLTAKNTPHITMVDYMFVPLYASQGVFEPLDGYILEADKADYIQGLLDDLRFKGQLYAVPYNRSTQGFYYNVDLYEKAGLGSEAPKTWEEFRDFSIKLRALGSDYYGGYAWFNRWYFEPIIQQWGARVNDENGNVTINEPEAVAALQFFQDLYLKDRAVMMQPTISGGFEQQNVDYAEGYVASTLQSTSWLTRMSSRVSFQWNFAFLPAGPAGHVVTNDGANIALLSDKTKAAKDAGWEFLAFMTATDETARLHIETGYMPVRYSALQKPEVVAFHQENPQYRVSIDQLEYARPTSVVAKNALEYNDVVALALEKILVLGADPKTALDEAAAVLQRAIDDLRKEGRLVL